MFSSMGKKSMITLLSILVLFLTLLGIAVCATVENVGFCVVKYKKKSVFFRSA